MKSAASPSAFFSAPLFALFVAATLAAAPPAAAQVSVSLADVPAPPIAARAYVLFDASSGQTLAQQAATDRFEPASLT